MDLGVQSLASSKSFCADSRVELTVLVKELMGHGF